MEPLTIKQHYWTVESLETDEEHYDWKEHTDFRDEPHRFQSSQCATAKAKELARYCAASIYKSFRVVEMDLVTKYQVIEIFETQHE